MLNYAKKFEEGLPYERFLDRYASERQRLRWSDVHAAVELSDDQRQLLSSFTREMKVAVVAGAWCGDCVEQCPILDHFASQSDKIVLRFFDRDEHSDLAADLAICGGKRVPTALFLSEDHFPCSRLGDRTLSKYRDLVSQLGHGAICPTGLQVPQQSALQAVLQEWLNEFERVQWILRTSPRLRDRHGD